MSEDINHGPRLTGEEYDRRITKLYCDLPPAPTKEQEVEVKRQELNLAVDHRLGQDFPLSRREALWAIQQRVEKKHIKLMFKHFLKRFFAKSLAHDAQGLAGYLVAEYAKELSQSELEAYFGKEEAHKPSLPINLEQL